MSNAMKKVTAFTLAAVLMLGLFAAAPQVAYAATVDVELNLATNSINIKQSNGRWETDLVNSGTYTDFGPETDTLRITGTLSDDYQIFIVGPVNGEIIFDTVIINHNSGHGVRINGSTLTITLNGTNRVTGGYQYSGLDIFGGSNVTISGSGSLECVGGINNGNGISISDASTLLITDGASVTATGNGTGWDIGKAAAGTGGSTLTVDGGASLTLGNTGIDTGLGNLASIFNNCTITGDGAVVQGVAGNYDANGVQTFFVPQIAIQGGASNEIPWNGTRTLEVTNVSDYISPAYKWYKDNGEITGQTTASLIVSDAGIYKVEVTDSGVMSSDASITLTKQAEPDTAAPTVVSVTPVNNATGVAISGDIAITFDEAIATTGTVSLDGGIGALAATTDWSNGNKTYTISYSGLDYSTDYTITIASFKDAAGNEMITDSNYSFTTRAIPDGPDVDPTSLTITTGQSKTFTVSLGQSGNEAVEATATSTNASIATISYTPDPIVTSGSAITVTGVSAGSTTISVSFSGGSYTGGDKTVSVTVQDPAPSTHSVTVQTNGYGTASASPDVVAAGATINLTASPNSGYYLSSWQVVSPSTLTIGGNSFIMPDEDVTVKAIFAKSSTSSSGSSGSGGSSNTPTYNITTDKQPNLPKTATLSYSGTVKNGRLTFTVTKAMVQAALDKAGTDPDGIALIFKISNTSGYTCQTVVIEESALALLKSSGVKYVQFDSAIARFRFDNKAISQLDSQTTGAVSVNANPAKLNEVEKKLIGSRPAFDITVQFKKSGTTYNVNDLGSGRMTRWIAYKPASGENTGNIAAVYVDKNGSSSWIEDSVYDNGWVSWTSGKLSVYGVGYMTPAPSFTDTASHWAKDYIDFAVSRGLISGTGTATFSPDSPMTRAVFLSTLGKLSGADVSGYTTSSFTDVFNTDPSMPYIEWAVANKIVQGIGGNKFGPDSTITREQMAVMIVNYAKTLNYTLPVAVEAYKFTDAASISAYAKDAITAVQQAGIIVGKTGGLFDPQGKATRAEGSTILQRFVELVIDSASARGWLQNDSGGWMYYDLTTGKLTTGWQDLSGNRYYFDKNGVMQSEKWLQIDSKWYYFQTDGTLAVDTKIDGYEIGPDGARK